MFLNQPVHGKHHQTTDRLDWAPDSVCVVLGKFRQKSVKTERAPETWTACSRLSVQVSQPSISSRSHRPLCALSDATAAAGATDLSALSVMLQLQQEPQTSLRSQ
ncbi:hypothetical protein ANANG_G00229260 [Anguilla anguilla]|uniref:Uncharacterized protein n=1 Tax=Anguilla anguilla TaxID=7936 RepID=A0A9D3LZG6_ANGAN|nr:hypothetical protein ANANG_G00229260 [Anguilla anguilla]